MNIDPDHNTKIKKKEDPDQRSNFPVAGIGLQIWERSDFFVVTSPSGSHQAGHWNDLAAPTAGLDHKETRNWALLAG